MTVMASLTIRTDDGVSLSAEWRCCPGASTAVVVAHGFAASRDHPDILGVGQAVLARGFDAVLYDARGHGRSDGRSTIGSMEDLDVAAVVATVAATGKAVILVGISMGGVAVASYLGGERVPVSVLGAVLVCTPAHWRLGLRPTAAAQAVLTRTGPGRWLAARRLGVRIAPGWRLGEPPVSRLRRVRLPVAVVQGTRDRLIPPAHGAQLCGAAAGPTMLELPASGHGAGPACLESLGRAVEWIEGLRQVPPSAG